MTYGRHGVKRGDHAKALKARAGARACLIRIRHWCIRRWSGGIGYSRYGCWSPDEFLLA